MSKIFSYIAVFALLAFAGWLAWLFFDNIRVADANVKAGLIGLLGVLTAAIITHYQTKKREINARHFADKREGYMNMIDLLFDLILAEKSGKELSEQGTLGKMMSFKKAMLVWGSPEIIETWNQYELDYAKGMTPERIVGRMESILRVMRKDLGHDDSALKAGHLWGLILKAEDKKKFLEALK